MKKKFLKIKILVLCILLSFFCFGCQNNATDKSVKIIATSDIHGWFIPYDYVECRESTKGGLTYIASKIEEIKKENENVILVDCGDSVVGNLSEVLVNMYASLPVIEEFNELNYDVWVFGNHEYNFEKDARDKFVETFNGVTLSGNVFLHGDNKSYLPGTTVVERDGLKIGIIGMTTPLVAAFEEGKKTIADFDVYNPLDLMSQCIKELKDKNVDCIIGIIHEGLDEEREVVGSGIRDIARSFPEIDVIIGGHNHVNIASEYEGDVLLCAPAGYASSFVELTLDFSYENGKYYLKNKTSKINECGNDEDEELAKLVQSYKELLIEYVETPFAKLINEDLCAKQRFEGLPGIYTGASGLVNFISAANMYYADADCFIMSTDNQDATIKVGDVCLQDIYKSYSYTSGGVEVYEMTGAQLKKILEWCGDYYTKVDGDNPKLAFNPLRMNSKYSTCFISGGISYDVDVREDVGNRIKNLMLIEMGEDKTPLLNEDGSLKLKEIKDDDIIKVGTTAYAMNTHWATSDGCLMDYEPKLLYSSVNEIGDYDGLTHQLMYDYVGEVCNFVIDGSKYNYENWKIIVE